MCLSVDLLVCPTLISLSLFYEQYSSSNSGIFQLYFFKYSFCLLFISFLSFWGSQYKYVGLLHHIPQISEVLFSFIHSFFLLFLRLDNFNCAIFKLADFSLCSNMSLNPCSVFFFSVIVLFILEFLLTSFNTFYLFY